MQHELFLDKHVSKCWIQTASKYKSKNRRTKVRFADLFSGCGGLSYGICASASDLGYSGVCALAIDFEPSALEVFRANIPYERGAVQVADVLNLLSPARRRGYTKKEIALKEQVGKIDILVAGPPCQGHSDLNNLTRRNDPRNDLYLASVRAAEVLEPDLVIIENVPTVVHSKEAVVQKSKDRLRKQGYTVNAFKIKFTDFGVPQSRKRHILVASKDRDFSNSLYQRDNSKQVPTLREFIEDLSECADCEGLMCKPGKLSPDNVGRVSYLFDNNIFDLPDTERPPCHRDKTHSYKSVYGRLNYDLPAQTITSGYGSMGQGRYIHPEHPRTINSQEAARIQGFPDTFDFSSVSRVTELRKMIANAVPPQLTYVISSHFLKFRNGK